MGVTFIAAFSVSSNTFDARAKLLSKVKFLKRFISPCRSAVNLLSQLSQIPFSLVKIYVVGCSGVSATLVNSLF